jgi:hypothetical protein
MLAGRKKVKPLAGLFHRLTPSAFQGYRKNERAGPLDLLRVQGLRAYARIGNDQWQIANLQPNLAIGHLLLVIRRRRWCARPVTLRSSALIQIVQQWVERYYGRRNTPTPEAVHLTGTS